MNLFLFSRVSSSHTFDDDLCGGVSVWLLNTGLAGVRGQFGDAISKSSCIVGVLPADAKWLWLYASAFRFGVEHCGSSDAKMKRKKCFVFFEIWMNELRFFFFFKFRFTYQLKHLKLCFVD